MLSIVYLTSWTRVKLNSKFGQRGAEMVEYAIILACITIVAFAYYHLNAWSNPSVGVGTTTKSALQYLFEKVDSIISKMN